MRNFHEVFDKLQNVDCSEKKNMHKTQIATEFGFSQNKWQKWKELSCFIATYIISKHAMFTINKKNAVFEFKLTIQWFEIVWDFSGDYRIFEKSNWFQSHLIHSNFSLTLKIRKSIIPPFNWTNIPSSLKTLIKLI